MTIVALSVAVIALNVLDSLTTWLAFRQYPDKKLREEGNPIMRRLMLRDWRLSHVAKHGLILALVIWWAINGEVYILRSLTVIFGLVVLNNTYVIVSRTILKRMVITPLAALIKLLHVPKPARYIFAVMTLITLAYIVVGIIW